MVCFGATVWMKKKRNKTVKKTAVVKGMSLWRDFANKLSL
jgi:hypothetical protein